MRWIAPVGAALALLCSACQSEKAGIEVICNAPSDAVECKNVDEAMRMQCLARHVADNLSNSEGKKLFEALAAATLADKHRMLSERAKALGLPSCPLADEFKAQAKAKAKRTKGKE